MMSFWTQDRLTCFCFVSIFSHPPFIPALPHLTFSFFLFNLFPPLFLCPLTYPTLSSSTSYPTPPLSHPVSSALCLTSCLAGLCNSSLASAWSEDSVETDVSLADIWQHNTLQTKHSIICHHWQLTVWGFWFGLKLGDRDTIHILTYTLRVWST